ncbi:sensor histidine kinase [Ruminococcus sp.]
MEKAEQSRKKSLHWLRIWRAVLIRLLLVAVVLIITVTALSGYAISKYKQDYYSNSMRVCDIMAKDFTECNAQNPQLDLWQEYIPKSVDKVSEQMQAFLYVFDADGSCRIASSNSNMAAADLTLNNEMLAGIRKGGEYLTDKASGKIDHSIVEPMLTRGFTFTLTENGVENTYYLFGASYTKPLNLYTTHLFLFMAILSFTLLLIAGVLIFYQVWRGNSQLEQLEAALQRYAQGDYSQPIPVEQYTSSNLELIAALSEQIGSQSGRAEESSRQFVSNVSHELRTPMTIISGFVEGILDGTVPKNKRMEYLSIVSQEVQRLKMLVTSMLNLTKFDAGTIQLNYRMFILNDTAFRTILMFENRLEKRHVSVEGLDGEPIRVCADPDLIGQVVYNLVENAVKFVNDGGTISFTFADEEDCWVFAVRNTGNGISKEELPKIFERFYKSDASRSQDKTGLGLGLDITKKIIHLHHAQISVRSEEHAYTEFEVRLPHVEPPEQEHE